MTPTPEKALKAVVEPKYISPSAISTAIPSIIALNGTSRVLFTSRQCLDHGIPPSRAKAQMDRETAVVQPMPQSRARTINGRRRRNAPVELPMADFMMLGTGCPDWRAMSSFVFGRTNTRGMRNKRPASVFMMMVPTMAFGTCRDGCWTSSHILNTCKLVIPKKTAVPHKKSEWGERKISTDEMTIPVDEVAYAACNSPTQKDQPTGQPDWGSKLVKTYSPLCLPFLAITNVQMTMAKTPAKVQKIAKVCH